MRLLVDRIYRYQMAVLIIIIITSSCSAPCALRRHLWWSLLARQRRQSAIRQRSESEFSRPLLQQLNLPSLRHRATDLSHSLINTPRSYMKMYSCITGKLLGGPAHKAAFRIAICLVVCSFVKSTVKGHKKLKFWLPVAWLTRFYKGRGHEGLQSSESKCAPYTTKQMGVTLELQGWPHIVSAIGPYQNRYWPRNLSVRISSQTHFWDLHKSYRFLAELTAPSRRKWRWKRKVLSSVWRNNFYLTSS